MADMILSVRDLSTRFFAEEGQVNAVENISFDVEDGEIFGIVDESDSGKSVIALSVIDLIESPDRVTQGEIRHRNADLAEEFRESRPDAVDGDLVDIRRLPEGVRRLLHDPSFGMVFQDPMSSFNPSITAGEQITETVKVQCRARPNPCSTRSRTQGYGLGSLSVDSLLPSKSYVDDESMDRTVELLDQVGIPDPEDRAEEYPHQFSGGMLQRAMIVQAFAGEPDVLITDESTAAFDVTIQARILNLLRDLQEQEGTSILTITHDLGVIARMCDRVGVMYADEVVEHGPFADTFDDPAHPYTQGLLGSTPDVDDPLGRLEPVSDDAPSLLDSEMPDTCYFTDGCSKAMADCLTRIPEYELDGQHSIRCVLIEQEYDPTDAVDSVNGGETVGEVSADD